MMNNARHVVLMFGLVVAVLVLVFLGRLLLQPKSFGVHGHYRWDAVGEMLARPVAVPGTASCAECHQHVYGLHEKDAHYSVPCVDCHPANAQHAPFHRGGAAAAGITAAQARMLHEYQLEGCLFCHRKLKARPVDFPQIDRKAHYAFLHVTDDSTRCIACHNPHEPIFLLTEARKARLHPIVYRCTDCHAVAPAKDPSTDPRHPTIFQCRDCHASIVASFEARPHASSIDCRTCHLFHVENERAGRMYKNGNARFCLLCHERAPFKDAAMPPKIAWPAHIGAITYISVIDQKTCLHCHWDKIHEMKLRGSGNPHPATWRAEHGGYLMKNFKDRFPAAKCGDCHARTFCDGCHRVPVPHPASFSDGHKDTVKKLGMNTCLTCHARDFCGTCHDVPN